MDDNLEYKSTYTPVAKNLSNPIKRVNNSMRPLLQAQEAQRIAQEQEAQRIAQEQEAQKIAQAQRIAKEQQQAKDKQTTQSVRNLRNAQPNEQNYINSNNLQKKVANVPQMTPSTQNNVKGSQRDQTPVNCDQLFQSLNNKSVSNVSNARKKISQYKTSCKEHKFNPYFDSAMRSLYGDTIITPKRGGSKKSVFLTSEKKTRTLKEDKQGKYVMLNSDKVYLKEMKGKYRYV